MHCLPSPVAPLALATQESAIEADIVGFCSSSACRQTIALLNPGQTNSALIDTACAAVPAPSGGTQVRLTCSVANGAITRLTSCTRPRGH